MIEEKEVKKEDLDKFVDKVLGYMPEPKQSEKSEEGSDKKEK